ncbi:MAG TPA: branched-chain amino acid ABC transporter substrate-binding protein [Azospirillaceae bacterium]|nr:branched-chain amino acid ABC transporter substrate-binding protein [Azospirillaceae bacterium]
MRTPRPDQLWPAVAGAALILCALLLPFLATPAKADIPIAMAGALTGPVAPVGEQVRQGTEAAVADLNASGGVLGEKLRLIIADDAGTPTQAVAVANRLATERVRMLVGHVQSSTLIPASAVYADEGIIAITPDATAPEVTEAGQGWVFRTCGRDDQQGAVAGAWLAREYKGRKVALVHDQSTYGKGLTDATQAAMKAAGLEPALYTQLTVGERDFTALVTRLKAAGVDAVFFGGFFTEAGLLVRQMREAGLQAQFVSADSLANDAFWQIAGKTGEGAMMTFEADVRSNPGAQEVIRKLKAKTGEEPGAFVLYAYAAVQVWAQAAIKAGTTEPSKVRDAMRQGSYPTIVGNISYDAKGDRRENNYVLYRWSEGRYTQVGK